MMDGLTASLSMPTSREGSKVVASKRTPEAERRKRQRQYQRLRPQIDALYDELHQQYPQTFFRDPEKIHPLKIGIDHDLREGVIAPCPHPYAASCSFCKPLAVSRGTIGIGLDAKYR